MYEHKIAAQMYEIRVDLSKNPLNCRKRGSLSGQYFTTLTNFPPIVVILLTIMWTNRVIAGKEFLPQFSFREGGGGEMK